jgi:hypothetical protein
MKRTRRLLMVIPAIALAAIVVTFIAAGVVVGFIWLSGVLGLERALGIDTQSSKNYDLVSGVLPALITSLGFSGLVVTMVKHINCEQPGCWRIGHRHPDHGRPVCRKHYHHDVVPTRPLVDDKAS